MMFSVHWLALLLLTSTLLSCLNTNTKCVCLYDSDLFNPKVLLKEYVMLGMYLKTGVPSSRLTPGILTTSQWTNCVFLLSFALRPACDMSAFSSMMVYRLWGLVFQDTVGGDSTCNTDFSLNYVIKHQDHCPEVDNVEGVTKHLDLIIGWMRKILSMC